MRHFAASRLLLAVAAASAALFAFMGGSRAQPEAAAFKDIASDLNKDQTHATYTYYLAGNQLVRALP